MIYRKHGAVARWENGTLIRVTESGIAIEEGEYFECRPESSNRRVAESSRVLDVAHALRELPIERLIITHGIAEHECEGRTWRDETDRIHLSLVHGTLRALVDSTTRRLDHIFTIADALQRAEQTERDTPNKLRLAPNVTAALLPHLAGRAPSNVRIVQTLGGVDGYGNEVVEAAERWPNFYRPSYRVRPVRMPFNLRIECDETHIDRDRPIAVALLGPIDVPIDNLTLRVLIVDGARVYPSRANISAISAVSKEREWYPYGAGVFGAEMML
jgi:hypothetical protein